MTIKEEYDSVTEYFCDLEKLISSGNEQEIYEFIKSSYLKSWNNKDLFPRLYEYNLEPIFNGILYNCICTDEEKLEMVEKYKFNIYPECEYALSKAKLECGKLSVEEVYEFATKEVYSKNAIKTLNLNSEWIDKFLSISNRYLANILLECTDMSFEQFVVALEKSETESFKNRKKPDGYLAQNMYSKYQISRLYPFTKEQEDILKPYCEYDIFMHSLEVEPTYDKIMSALSNKFKRRWGYDKLGEAIKKVKLDKKGQLEILKAAVENELEYYDINHIAMGLLSNEDFEVDTLIEMCRIPSMQSYVYLGYSNLDKMFIKTITDAKFTKEQKEEFKKSKIYIALDAASQRDDFTLDDCIEMFKNECNYTEDAVRNIISKFVKPDNNKEFNSENELSLAKLHHPLINYLLINKNNLKSKPETIINYVKPPLDCDMYENSDKILMRMIRNTTFTDEQFDEILASANNFPKPTNAYLIKEIKTKPKNLHDFIESIPDEEKKQYFKESREYIINLNWAIYVNSGLISQPRISFERICKILSIVNQNKTRVIGEEFNRTINHAKPTISQLEELMKLGVGTYYIQEKLNKMKNNASTDHKVKLKTDKKNQN